MESTSAQHKFDAPGSRAGVTVDFVALLSRLGTASAGEGATTTEIAEAMGCGVEKVRRLVKQAVREGKCRATRKTVDTISGTKTTAPSYVLVQEVEQ